MQVQIHDLKTNILKQVHRLKMIMCQLQNPINT